MMDQKTLSTLLALCLMCGILAVIFAVYSNTNTIAALARSHDKLVELNEKIGLLTDNNTRARRSEAAQWRQLIEFCKSGLVQGQKCREIPDEQTLKILER